MAERLIHPKSISRIERVLKSGVTAEKGHIACIDLDDGKLVAGAVDTNFFPIGWFEETTVGDDSIVVGVKLFKELECVWVKNASSGPVTDAYVGRMVYLHSSFEASITSTGKSFLGRCWGVSGAKVLVQPTLGIGPQGIQGPEGT